SSLAGTHRRAVRTGFDLHDGPIQQVLVTALELQTLRRDLEELPDDLGRKPLARVSTVHDRLVALEGELRDLAHSLETPSWSDVPLEESVRTELTTFERESGIELQATIDGYFARTSRSQRIAVRRVLQGALANVRQHSGAKSVRVALTATPETIELSVEDDGRGFVIRNALADASGGRLGIVAMGERVRLLGGEFDLDSRPGGPTRISVSLRSQPTSADLV
ncbi:MAG: sensor histidine kinase, partial [Solirubrobacteraceae bacterium]